MPRSTAPRSMAEDLRSRDDAALVALLRGRPDLAAPPPTGTTSLAARASTRVSVQRALDRLDAAALAVLEVVVALPEPVSAGEVLAATGARADDEREAVAAQLARARALALVWGGPDALHPVRALVDLLGPAPGGLGPPLREALGTRSPARVADIAADLGLGRRGDPVADLAAVAAALADPERLAELLAGAPPASRELLDRLVPGPPAGAVAGADRVVRAAEATSPLDWLLARGLLVASAADRVVLPREVALALRGGVVARVPLSPPDLDVAEGRADLLEGSAALRAGEAVRLVEALLEAWSAAPPPVLRSGGLGVRELKRVGDRLEVEPDEAAFWVELVRAAGLAADDGEADPAWAPTPAYDAWREQEVPARWAVLARSWLRTSRVAGLVGSKDARGATRAPLADDLDRTSAPEVRSAALAALAQLPAGASAGEESLRARVRWSAPRRAGALADALVTWSLREAAWLGLTAAGALAAPGRALVAAPLGGERAERAAEAGAAAALAAALPAPVEAVLLQADLTAVAPGPLTAPLAAELALLADVDSRGGGVVYRFSPASVRRALDAGRSADDVLALLAGASTTPVPQALEVLVRDAARRHGRLRVGVASAYLRAEDEAVLAEVLADRRTGGLGLRALAPTVAAARAHPAKVLEVLRGLGLAPVVEGEDADVLLRAPAVRRTPPRTRPLPVTGQAGAATPARAAAVVSALRRADEDGSPPVPAASSAPGPRAEQEVRPPAMGTAADPALALESLRAAAGERRAVWVGVSDRTGRTSVRLLEPVEVVGGVVTALDPRTGEVTTLAAHRVTGVAPV